MKRAIFIVFFSFLVGIAAWSAGKKENGESFLFKYSNQQGPNHPRTRSMVFFKKELEKASNGRIRVKIYDSGVLGNEKELFEMVVTGSIQGYRGAYYEQLNPQYYIYNVPFLFNGYDALMKFDKSDFAKSMNKKGSVKGIYIPATGYTGFRNILNRKRPINSPEDLAGLKMRTPSQVPIIDFYRQMGAHPQEMQSSEIYMALKTGVVDGTCSSVSDLATYKFYEVAPYFSVINYMAGADPFMVNMAWYEKLPDDLKKIFDEVSEKAMAYSDKLIKNEDQKYIDILQKDSKETSYIQGKGREEFVKKAQPLWQNFVDAKYITWDDLKKVQAIVNN